MAILARRALCPTMRIVVFMAVTTCSRRLDFIYRFDMTGLALELHVCAMEGVIRVDIVIKCDEFKSVRRMASFALFAEVTVVVVIFKMAGNTCGIQAVTERILAVAVTACKQSMFAGQLEGRVTGVVERRILPSSRLVTVLTLFPAASGVGVIVRMASITGCWCFREGLVGVAVEAACRLMFSQQLKVRRIVVEEYFRPPAGCMTVATFSAHRFSMDIVRLMARETV